MIMSFEPPDELVDFMIDAARAAAEVVEKELQRKRPAEPRYVPKVTPLEVLGPGKRPPVAKARHIVAQLARRHVFIEALAGTKGTMQLAIVFNAEPPFQNRSSRPLSYPMIGWLIGRCHTTFMHEPQAGPIDVATVAAADVCLSTCYPTGAIVCEATFKARMRSWKDQ